MSENNKRPSFQFYPTDWLSDPNVIAMTAEQRGGYIQLLATMWTTEDCLLWDNDDYLCSISGLTKVPLSLVKRCFKRKGKNITHKRLQYEREKQNSFRKKCSAAGKRGGGNPSLSIGKPNPYYENKDKGTFKGEDKGEDKGEINSSSPSPSPSSSSSLEIPKEKEKKKTTPVSQKKLVEKTATEIHEYYVKEIEPDSRYIEKAKTILFITQLLDEYTPEMLRKTVDNYKKIKDDRYTLKPSNFFSNSTKKEKYRCFLDYTEEAKAPLPSEEELIREFDRGLNEKKFTAKYGAEMYNQMMRKIIMKR